MLEILRAENLKYKRSFHKKLVIGIPLFFAIAALPQKMFMPSSYARPWPLLLDQVFNWWTVAFIPLGVAILCTLLATQENKAGRYRLLRAHDVSPVRLWIGKIVVLGLYCLLATAVFSAAIVFSGTITAKGDLPLLQIGTGAALSWIAMLALIPIQLWLSAWRGPVLAMLVGLSGLIAGIATAATKWWVCVPWSWPIRMMCPVIGVHPNGVALRAADTLRDPSVIAVGIGLSLVVFVVGSLAGALWFSKREV